MQPVDTDNPRHSNRKLYKDRNLLIIFTVSLIAILGVASVTPAFPRLRIGLEVPVERIGLLVTVFTFPTVILGPIIGILADRSGRKKSSFLRLYSLV